MTDTPGPQGSARTCRHASCVEDVRHVLRCLLALPSSALELVLTTTARSKDSLDATTQRNAGPGARDRGRRARRMRRLRREAGDRPEAVADGLGQPAEHPDNGARTPDGKP